MSEIRTLGPWLERFFLEHVITERNLAINTRKSYRDTFKLFLPFVCTKLKKPDDRLLVRDLTSSLVLQFLAHLEEDRGCSAQTRNQRLTAIRAFARFVGSRDPVHVAWCGHIRAIQSKKSTPQPIGYLTKVEVDAMLEVPDRKTLRGRTEYALLQFLYNTGARVSEATQLKVGDLGVGGRDGRHALVTLHGKGGKIRQCPLLPDIERVLAEQVAGRADSDTVFLSRYRSPYTRFGVYRLVERCAASVPELVGKKIRTEAYDCIPLGDRGSGHQHSSCMARSRLDQHDERLCRDRSRNEGQGIGTLRHRREEPEPSMEGEEGLDGLPEIVVS